MRCFIAIDLDKELQDKIRMLCHSLEQLNDSALAVVKGNYHITLAFLGELTIEKAEEIRQGLEKIECGQFDMELNDVGVFEDKGRLRTIWLACHGIPRQLTEQIDNITGESRQKPFRAHITIARVNKKPNDSLADWLKDHSHVSIGKQPVRKILLKRSLLQSYGAVHQTFYEKYLN